MTLQLLKKNLPKASFQIGFAIGCVISIYSFFQYPIDPLGMVFLPLMVLAIAVPMGIIGCSIAYIFKSIFIEHHYFNIKLLIILIIIWPVSQVALITWQIISPNNNQMYTEIYKMDSKALDVTLDQLINKQDKWHANKMFELAAIIQNSKTSAVTLEKIVDMNDDKLYQPIGFAYTSLFNKNKDTSVMSLMIDHPNVTPKILNKIYPRANPKLKNKILIKMKRFDSK